MRYAAASSNPSGSIRAGAIPGPLSGWTVAGEGFSSADALAARHLAELGARPCAEQGFLRAGHEAHMVEAAVDWAGLDEATAQAAYGLMAVHGRAEGLGPQRLGVDYVTAAAGVIAAQGILAALLAGLRSYPITTVSVPVASAALLTVSQYLAAGTAHDPEHIEPPAPRGTPPPFVSRDGVRFELETLDPQPWADLWTALRVEPFVASRGWKAFVLRYATATASLPIELHEATRSLPYQDMERLAAQTGVAIQPVRRFEQRLQDIGGEPRRLGPVWTVDPLTDATAPATRPMRGELALSGLRVVEAGRRIQGPLAGHVLGMLGADVIRIEPVGGDPLRGMPPMVGECSARFLALNRGKQIVEADLRSVGGRAKVYELACAADVFLHNWAPGKAEGMGLGAADLAAANPGLVYAYASGWGGERGVDAPPGTDFVAQAYSGLAHNVRMAGEPPAGSLMTLLDVLGGLIAAEGAIAGLIARHRTGYGQRVHSSLLSAAGALQLCVAEADAGAQPRWGPWDRPVRTADGYVMAAAASRPSVTPENVSALPTSRAVAELRAAGLTAVRVCPDPAALADDPQMARYLDFDGCAFVRPPWRFVP